MLGITFSSIARAIAFRICEFRSDLISSNFLDICEEIFEFIALLISAVISLFSLVLVFNIDIKFTLIDLVSLCSLLDS